jgi:hypothetical protein
VLPGYHGRPGRYFLPSGFTLVRIYTALTNLFSLSFFLLNYKLPILVLIWGLEQKKLESVFPQKFTYTSRNTPFATSNEKKQNLYLFL